MNNPDTELKVTHFIPSVELVGSRADKLKKLDTLIEYLVRLRKALAGDAPGAQGGFEVPSRYINGPAWPWFTTGALVGAAFLLLLIFARVFSTTYIGR